MEEISNQPTGEVRVLTDEGARAVGDDKGWDNESYNPTHWYQDKLIDEVWRGRSGPFVSQTVQVVIENRDCEVPEVRPFLIVQVLDASIGLVNGILFLANSEIRDGEAGVLGWGMSQAVRQAGFEVPNAAKGIFWLERVRFHPSGLPRQQTQMVEKEVPRHLIEKNERGEVILVPDGTGSMMVPELLWESPGRPLLEATWRWAQ